MGRDDSHSIGSINSFSHASFNLKREMLAFCHCDKISEKINLKEEMSWFQGFQCGQLVPLLWVCDEAENHG